MHEVRIDNEVIMIPGEWNEFNREQLLYLSGLIVPGLEVPEFKVKILLKCLGLKVEKQNIKVKDNEAEEYFEFATPSGEKKFISAMTISELAEIYEFMFESPQSTDDSPQNSPQSTDDSPQIVKYYISSKLTKNLVSEIRGLYGPADRLTNIKFKEWIHSEINYIRYVKSRQSTVHSRQIKADEYLNKLIATLYRPQSTVDSLRKNKGDKREELDDFTIDARAWEIEKWDWNEKKAVLLFYEGVRNYYLPMRFPRTFDNEGNGNEDVFNSMMRMVDILAGNDVTKKDSVRDAMLYDVLFTWEESLNKK